MSQLLGKRPQATKIWSLLIIIGVIGAAALFGFGASRSLLVLLLGALGALLLLQRPVLSLLVIVLGALLIKVNIGTGSAVSLNTVMLVIPAVFVLWLLDMARKGDIHLLRSRTNLPLFLLLLTGTGSLLIGNATWDPFVPRTPNFLLVQLGQLAVFYLSAAVYVLVANLVKDVDWLRYLTWTFVAVGGLLAVLLIWPPSSRLVSRIATEAVTRAPFWMLLVAIAGGQLLFNRSLAWWVRLLLILILFAVGYYALVLQREVISAWIGGVAAVAMLFWLRFPRLRWLVLLIVLLLLIVGILFPAVYEFAGGDAEWQLSGISRIDLGRRVLEVTMHNPLTGLGPASYRLYASVEPLIWRGGTGIWLDAVVSSHNNYIDIFSFFGVVGLALFLWFMAEVALLGLRLRKRLRSGFESGYANSMLAAWAGTMVLMLFADWFLPFVYNVGFSGFQASILIWLFMGGLVALDNFNGDESTQK